MWLPRCPLLTAAGPSAILGLMLFTVVLVHPFVWQVFIKVSPQCLGVTAGIRLPSCLPPSSSRPDRGSGHQPNICSGAFFTIAKVGVQWAWLGCDDQPAQAGWQGRLPGGRGELKYSLASSSPVGLCGHASVLPSTKRGSVFAKRAKLRQTFWGSHGPFRALLFASGQWNSKPHFTPREFCPAPTCPSAPLLLMTQRSQQTSPHPSWGRNEEHRRLLDHHNLIKSRLWVSPGNPLTCWLLTDQDWTRDWLALGSRRGHGVGREGKG